MTNCPFPDISELRDVESLNLLHQAAESGRMDWAWRVSGAKAGIMPVHLCSGMRHPMELTVGRRGSWSIPMYRNHVAAALRDPDSVLHYYRVRLLCAEWDVLRYGDFSLLLHEHLRYLPMRGL